MNGFDRGVLRLLLKKSRKTDTPLAAAAEEFLKCLGPRLAAFALLKNSRKTDAPLAAAAEEFLKRLGRDWRPLRF